MRVAEHANQNNTITLNIFIRGKWWRRANWVVERTRKACPGIGAQYFSAAAAAAVYEKNTIFGNLLFGSCLHVPLWLCLRSRWPCMAHILMHTGRWKTMSSSSRRTRKEIKKRTQNKLAQNVLSHTKFFVANLLLRFFILQIRLRTSKFYQYFVVVVIVASFAGAQQTAIVFFRVIKAFFFVL